jgi:hypothetical protein
MQVNRDRLSADRADSVTVTLTLKDQAGLPLSGKKIFLKASHGTFSEPKDLGQGRYSAMLHAPAQAAPRRPDYLLIVASALLDNEGPAAGAAIPIYSNLVLQGNAAPGITMYASAGGRRLGAQVTTGSDGKFRLVAPVPPGVSSVTITAGKDGQEKTSSVDIGAGQMTRHVVQSVPDKLAAGGAPAFLNVFAIQASGRPENADKLKITTDTGATASTLQYLGGGVFQSRITLLQANRDKITVNATYAGVRRSSSFAAVSPGLARIAIRADATEVYPGQTVILSLEGYDFADRPLAGALISIYANGTFTGQAVDRGMGLYQFEHTISQLAAEPEITIHAQGYAPDYPDNTARSSDLRIRLLLPEISLSAEPAETRLNAGQTAAVRVRAESRMQGDGVSGLTLRIIPEAGEAAPVRDLGGGDYAFDYTAPAEYQGRSLIMEIRADAVPGNPSAQAAFEWLGPGAPFGEAQQIDLSASSNTVAAGGIITLTATLKDSARRGVPGRDVVFTTGAGMLGATADKGDGAYTTQLTVPDVAPSGDFSAKASCACGGANLAAETSLTVPTKPPAAISLTTDNNTVYLSGSVDATMRVTVTDSLGQGVADQAVTITAVQSNGSQTVSATTDASGGADAAITLSPPSGQAAVTASLDSNPSISGSLIIEKIKHPVSRLELTALPQSIPANGAATIDVEAYAIDEAGAEAADERIDFTLLSGSGRLNTPDCTTDENGRCTVQYTSGLACGAISIEAFPYSQDTVRQTVSAQETPAVPASLELDNTVPAAIVANGTDEWAMQVLARDAGQCPVAGETLSFSIPTGSGSVEGTSFTDSGGVASAKYTAGLAPGDVGILTRSNTSPLVMLSTAFTLLPWQPSSYDVEASTTTPTAGTQFTITVTARDFFGNIMTSWDASDLIYSMSGPANAPNGVAPLLPSNATVLAAFHNGVATLNVTLYKSETVSLSFTDSKVTGLSPAITVQGASAASFDASAGASQTAGAPFTVSITAKDTYGNVATYNPAGTTFSFTGPATSPDGFAPSYATSAAAAAAFSSSSASLSVTLYKAETTTLTISQGAISGATGNITVAREQASKITAVQGNNQTQIITTALAQPVAIKVSDAYGNPIPSAAVIFAITGGGGSATGLNKTTGADGRTGPDSWTMGNTIGANTMSATFTEGTGGSVTITATAYVPAPNAVITLEDTTNYICPGDTINLTGANSTASAVSSILSYSWDFAGGTGGGPASAMDPAPLTFAASNTYQVTLTVTDNFSQSNSASYYVLVSHVPGPLTLSASPASIPADGVAITTITSATIYDCAQAPIANGMLFTVAPSLGIISSGDDSGLAGIQEASSGGVIQFTVRAGTDLGTSVIVAQSVEFATLTANTSVQFTGPDIIRPYVVSYSPAGHTTGNVSQVTVVFSETVAIESDDFKIKKDGMDVQGAWNYTSGNRTATFIPHHTLHVDGATVDVTVKSSIEDLAGNHLDGLQTGGSSSFVFSFGGDITSSPPVVASCIDAPASFSPDPTDGLPDTTHITFAVTDDTYAKYWRVYIKSGASIIRSYVQYNTCSCDNICAANTIACNNCCTNVAAPAGCCTTTSGDVSWDGKRTDGDFAANGDYDYEITAYDLDSNASAACASQTNVNNPIDFGGFGP